MSTQRTLPGCERATVAAEFAMVLPLLLILLFGIIDGGRLMWEINKAQKATQVGARMLAVTSPLAPGLTEADYVGTTGDDGSPIASGDAIPLGALGTILCTEDGCTCETAPCPEIGDANLDQFADVLVTRMSAINPSVGPENVEVRYSGAGIGSAGDLIDDSEGGGEGGGKEEPAEQMEVAPMITVSLTGMQFRPISLLTFVAFNLPSFATSMTAEDASGTVSN